jgi:hypothetical protein
MQINRRVTGSKQQTEVAGQKIKKIREDVRIQFTLYVAYILSTTLSHRHISSLYSIRDSAMHTRSKDAAAT